MARILNCCLPPPVATPSPSSMRGKANSPSCRSPAWGRSPPRPVCGCAIRKARASSPVAGMFISTNRRPRTPDRCLTRPMATLISHRPEETAALGERWGREAAHGAVIGLTGDLGAGKTLLVKGFARGLDITAPVLSPTFALVNEYREGRLPLFHLDLFRLETRRQIIDAGLEQYLFQPPGIAVVERIERWLGDLQRVKGTAGAGQSAGLPRWAKQAGTE